MYISQVSFPQLKEAPRGMNKRYTKEKKEHEEQEKVEGRVKDQPVEGNRERRGVSKTMSDLVWVRRCRLRTTGGCVKRSSSRVHPFLKEPKGEKVYFSKRGTLALEKEKLWTKKEGGLSSCHK